MIRKLFYFAFILLALSCSNNKKNTESFPVLTGDYLDQILPGDSATLFASGIISSGMADRDITMTPDGNEIYFCRNMANFRMATIFYSKRMNGKWSKPKVVEFATDPRYIYIEPCISSDGSKFYFASNKPKDGTEPGSMDIWVAERIGDSWGEPYNIGIPINTKYDQYYPSLTKSGTIYFTSEDSTNEEFIYRSKLVDGIYQEPELLPKNINMGRARFNAYISPNEDFIIVPAFGMPDSYGATDYYIVFRNSEDHWSNPINMGEKVNSANGQEWSASLSPDGKFLFFMSAGIPENSLDINEYSTQNFKRIHNRPQNGSSDIYWIKADFINKLKEKAEFKK